MIGNIGILLLVVGFASSVYQPSADIYCRLLKGSCNNECSPPLRGVPSSFLCQPPRICCFEVNNTTPQTTDAPTTRPPIPECGVSKGNPATSFASQTFRIIGGDIAQPNEFPWVVSLNTTVNGPCGGVLIDDRNILTASHCLRSFIDNTLLNPQVNISEYDKTRLEANEAVNVQIARVITHENFSLRSFVNDVALIHLETPLNFGLYTDVSPICLPSVGNEVPPVGTDCIVVGWGTLSATDNTQITNVLQKVVLPIVNNTFCDTLFGSYYYRPTNLCAGVVQGGKDACGGDSGGPLMCPVNNKWQVVGVVSYGIGCAEAETAGAYTKVSSFLKWIEDNRAK